MSLSEKETLLNLYNATLEKWTSIAEGIDRRMPCAFCKYFNDSCQKCKINKEICGRPSSLFQKIKDYILFCNEKKILPQWLYYEIYKRYSWFIVEALKREIKELERKK